MTHSFIKLGIRITLILGVVLFLAFVTVFNRDFIGTTFATGGLNLKIDSYSMYNGVVQQAHTWALKNLVPGVDTFFNFSDIKPGDTGKNIISFHTTKNAWMCMDFINLVDQDNGNNEPESHEDTDGFVGGELSKGIEFFGWFDDGDNTYEVGEKTIFGTSTPQAGFDVLKKYILADATSGNYFPADTTKYVGIEWCAGDQIVNTNTGVITCDGSMLGNSVQTDSFSVDVALRAVTADDYPGYKCDGSVPPPPVGPIVTLNLEKKFSGPVPSGYLPEQFVFRVEGPSVNQIVTLTPYTQDSAYGTVELQKGTYTITEIGPDGFVAGDWRPGWYGECKKGSTYVTTITINNSNIDDGTLYCQVDNQYRPANKNKSQNQTATQQPVPPVVPQNTQNVQIVENNDSTGRVNRVVNTVRNTLRR